MDSPSGSDRAERFRCFTPSEARAFYDRFGSKQDSQAFYEDHAVDDLLQHAEFGTAQAVFEFGCGTGRLAAKLLATQLPSSARYVGRDLSATMVGLARERLAQFAPRAEVQLSDGTPRIAAADATFDRFVSTYVLDLLAPEAIRGVLSEAHRLLVPDGRLCLVGLTGGTTPVSRFVSWLWSQLHRLRPQLVGGCRPLAVCGLLSSTDWQILHHNVVIAYGIPSEVIVAAKR